MKKKTFKGLLVTASLTALSLTIAGCSDDTSTAPKPPKPKDKNCNDWKWDQNLGVWKCSDSTSSHNGAYFYGRNYYSSSDELKKSSGYKSYSKSSSFAGEGAHSVSSGHESGFGGHVGGGE